MEILNGKRDSNICMIVAMRSRCCKAHVRACTCAARVRARKHLTGRHRVTRDSQLFTGFIGDCFSLLGDSCFQILCSQRTVKTAMIYIVHAPGFDKKRTRLKLEQLLLCISETRLSSKLVEFLISSFHPSSLSSCRPL
jgi:hypothetical protein